MSNLRLTRRNLRKVDDARLLLAIQGFLSDAENEKVQRRIERWLRKNGVTEIRQIPLCAADEA